MTVYIVGVEITEHDYYSDDIRGYEVPHLLGIFTNKDDAIDIANEFGGRVQEVETDTILNDNRETTCDYECCGDYRSTDCDNCKYTYDILNNSGIAII